jgi:hypothetical protein
VIDQFLERIDPLDHAISALCVEIAGNSASASRGSIPYQSAETRRIDVAKQQSPLPEFSMIEFEQVFWRAYSCCHDRSRTVETPFDMQTIGLASDAGTFVLVEHNAVGGATGSVIPGFSHPGMNPNLLRAAVPSSHQMPIEEFIGSLALGSGIEDVIESDLDLVNQHTVAARDQVQCCVPRLLQVETLLVSPIKPGTSIANKEIPGVPAKFLDRLGVGGLLDPDLHSVEIRPDT